MRNVVEIDQEFKDLLDKTREALLAKVDKLKEVRMERGLVR